jgi:hydrocephalus-inducing protein
MKFNSLTFFIGKTANAVSIAKYYSAACLNIDSVILEAMSDGNNSPGMRARELCIRAAIEQSMREAEDFGKTSFSPAGTPSGKHSLFCIPH